MPPISLIRRHHTLSPVLAQVPTYPMLPKNENSAFLAGMGYAALATLGIGGVGGFLLWRYNQRRAAVVPQSETTAVVANAPTTTKPEFKQFEESGDAYRSADVPDLRLAVGWYGKALGEIFSRAANGKLMLEIATIPVAFQLDIQRIRQKISETLVAEAKAGAEWNPYGLAKELAQLGPALMPETVDSMWEVAVGPDQLLELANALDAMRSRLLNNDYKIPDYTRDMRNGLAKQRITVLLSRAALSRSLLTSTHPSDEDFARVAAAYQDVVNVDDTQTEAGQLAIHFYRQAAEQAMREGRNAEVYYRAIAQMPVEIADSHLDFVTLAMRVLSFDEDAQVNWAELAERQLGVTPETSPLWEARAFDAATQWFLQGDYNAASDIFRKIVGDAHGAEAWKPMLRLAFHIEVTPVMAALCAFDVALKNPDIQWEGVRPDNSFDIMQRSLAEAVDGVIRAVPRPAIASLGRWSLSDRLSSDVNFAAAVTEVMRSGRNAPLAMDQAVGALQTRGLGKFDPIEIRKALSGEAVAGELSDALFEALPLHVRPEWKGYIKQLELDASVRDSLSEIKRLDSGGPKLSDSVAP